MQTFSRVALHESIQIIRMEIECLSDVAVADALGAMQLHVGNYGLDRLARLMGGIQALDGTDQQQLHFCRHDSIRKGACRNELGFDLLCQIKQPRRIAHV